MCLLLHCAQDAWRWPAEMSIGGRVDSSEVDALENRRSGRPSGGFADSAGTARTLVRAMLAGGGLGDGDARSGTAEIRAQRPREVSRAGRKQLRGPCLVGLQSPADFTFVSRACGWEPHIYPSIGYYECMEVKTPPCTVRY